MKTNLVRIGNSRGIRIPKPIIEECQLSEEVDMEVKGRSIVISPIRPVREDWEDAFQRMPSGLHRSTYMCFPGHRNSRCSTMPISRCTTPASAASRMQKEPNSWKKKRLKKRKKKTRKNRHSLHSIQPDG